MVVACIMAELALIAFSKGFCMNQSDWQSRRFPQHPFNFWTQTFRMPRHAIVFLRELASVIFCCYIARKSKHANRFGLNPSSDEILLLALLVATRTLRSNSIPN